MAKSDARFEYQAQMGRSDFDLSQPLGFTSTSGMLLPIWCDFATPGDSYYMQHDLPLLRSQVLAAPAMVDVKVHFETFFVPCQMFYQPLENALFSLSGIQSSLYQMQDLQNQNLPLLNFGFMVQLLTNYQAGGLMGSAIHADAFRLCDLLDMSADALATYLDAQANRVIPNEQAAYLPNFFPWKLLAYHTIFQYYYRLDDKEQFDNNFCNWDRNYNQTNPVTYSTDVNLFEIHQRPWDFDYYSSMYRSPIVSSANLQTILPVGEYNPLTSSDVGSLARNSTDPSSNELVAGFGRRANSADQWNIRYASNTAFIRSAFANEKLAMITGRTKKNYDSQVLAHYGVKVPHDVKHDITCIHHDEYDLNVMEVTSLASTTDSPLGELAGKSYSSGNGEKFKFVAPCHGVIMTIFSVEPRRRYINNFSRDNAISNVFDLPVPEFDRLGNVPMYRYECGRNVLVSGELDTDIIGWKERYYQFKRRMPKATRAFDWVGSSANTYASYMLSQRPFVNSYSNGYSQIIQTPAIRRSFYIDRHAMDQLCLVPWVEKWQWADPDTQDENWTLHPYLVYARDPFIINSHIKCKKVSWMSKDGEPIYNF